MSGVTTDLSLCGGLLVLGLAAVRVGLRVRVTVGVARLGLGLSSAVGLGLGSRLLILAAAAVIAALGRAGVAVISNSLGSGLGSRLGGGLLLDLLLAAALRGVLALALRRRIRLGLRSRSLLRLFLVLDAGSNGLGNVLALGLGCRSGLGNATGLDARKLSLLVLLGRLVCDLCLAHFAGKLLNLQCISIVSCATKKLMVSQ